MTDVRSLELRLASLRGARLAKSSACLRDACEARAALLFRRAVDASGVSQREIARRLGVDERSVRDWMVGARPVPTYALLSLPRDGQVEALDGMLAELPPESTGTNG